MMMAPEGEGFGILRMSLKYADWNQGVNACGSILPKHISDRAFQPTTNLLQGCRGNLRQHSVGGSGYGADVVGWKRLCAEHLDQLRDCMCRLPISKTQGDFMTITSRTSARLMWANMLNYPNLSWQQWNARTTHAQESGCFKPEAVALRMPFLITEGRHSYLPSGGTPGRCLSCSPERQHPVLRNGFLCSNESVSI
jgi:hypothetical protein